MLLLLRRSYLSVVADQNDPGRVVVRARLQGHIERIFPHALVIARSDTQYRYRAFIANETFAQVISSEVNGLMARSAEWEQDQTETRQPYRAVDAVMAQAQAGEPFPAAPGEPLPAIRADWQVKPMLEPTALVPVDLQLSHEQLAKVRLGLVAAQMEDKWSFFFEDPWLYCVRSWTGQMPAAVRIEPTDEGANITQVKVSMNPEAGKWETPDEAASLALEAVLLCLLGVWASDPAKVSEEDSLKAWAHHGRAILGQSPAPGVPYKPKIEKPEASS